MTDPIADMLARIRNALMARRDEVSLPYSKIKESIAAILKQRAFIADYAVEGSGTLKTLRLVLGEPNITALVRISKPGRRIYASNREIPRVMAGKGLVIISTPGGVMSGQEARKKRLGGELICKVW